MSSTNMRFKNWKRVIELDLPQTYAQRINASFEYLNSSGNGSGEFTLKDLTEKGKTVFDFLCIDVDLETSFSIMDTFRHFDRVSSRSVTLVAFVTGIVELLSQFVAESNKIQTIAMDMMPLGKQTARELISIIDSLDGPPSSYKQHFNAMSYMVKAHLKLAGTTKMDWISPDILVHLFKDAIDNVIVEIQQYFHISNEKLYSLICEFTGSHHSATAISIKSTMNRNNIRHFKLFDLATSTSSCHNSSAGGGGNYNNTSEALNSALLINENVSTNTNNSPQRTNRRLACLMQSVMSNTSRPTNDHMSNTLNEVIQSFSTIGSTGPINCRRLSVMSSLKSPTSMLGYTDFKKKNEMSVMKDHSGVEGHSNAAVKEHIKDVNMKKMGPNIHGSHCTTSYSEEMKTAMEFLNKLGFNSPFTATPTKKVSSRSHKSSSNMNKVLMDIDLKYADLDSSEIFTLQNAYKSLQTFLDLTCGSMMDPIPALSDQVQKGGVLPHSHSERGSISSGNGKRKLSTVLQHGNDNPHKRMQCDNNGKHKRHDSIASILSPRKDYSASSKRLNMPIRTLFKPNLYGQGNHVQHDDMYGDDELDDCVLLKYNFPSDDLNNNIIANDLITAQDRLKRLSVRLDILESLQKSMGLDSSVNYDDEPSPVGAAALMEKMISKQKREAERLLADTTNETKKLAFKVSDMINKHNHDRKYGTNASGESKYKSKSYVDKGLTGTNESIEDDEYDGEEVVSFQSIVNEVNSLKSSIAFRGLLCSPAGALLEVPSAIVPLSVETNSSKNTDNTGNDKQKVELIELLSRLVTDSEVLQNEFKDNSVSSDEITKLKFTIDMQAEQIRELTSAVEIQSHEKADYLSSAVELQMLREEVRVFRENGGIVRDLQLRNHEQQQEMQQIRAAWQLAERKCRDMTFQLPKADSVAIETINKNHMKEIEELESTKSKLTKDTQRLLIAIKQSEQRTKAALQDQLILRQRLNKAEEELSGAKAFVTKLLSDIEIEKKQRTDRDELDLKVQELHRVIITKDAELTEARELAAATRKLKQELHRAEAYASSLEEKVGEVTAESERGFIAIEHLDNYREQLRQKTIEARELSLSLHSLEAELREVKQFQAKHKLMEQELHDLRIKVEKFPPLIAEITRLRSSSRAVAKTLQEQDKAIVLLREKSKTTDTEITRYKAEIRSLRDVEGKLKEANIEIKRLQAMVGEVNALRLGAKNAEEERNNMENQYKKMRRAMRASLKPTTQAEEAEPDDVEEVDDANDHFESTDDGNESREVSNDTIADKESSIEAESMAAKKAKLGGIFSKMPQNNQPTT